MKKFRYILFISFSCIILSYCTKNQKAEEIPDKASGIDSFSDFYNYLPELILPYSWEENKYHFKEIYHPLPKKYYHLFGDSASLHDVHIAKLPTVDSIRPILLYQSANKSDTVDVYSLSESLQIIDKLRLAGKEKYNDKSSIIQTFIIIPPNQFKTFKNVDSTLIEQLYHEIDTTGLISEIHNGELPFIAYQTFYDSIFQVDSFKWNKTKNGGLYKKDLSERFYLLNDKGKVSEINKKNLPKH